MPGNVIGLITAQKREIAGPPGPPFVPTSADNGLSVDPISGRIVLGNDVGGSSAILLSAREIPNGGFNIAVKDVKSTFGAGFGSSNFPNGSPEIFNGYSSDSDVNGYFNQNASLGTHAATVYGAYNAAAINYLFGVTGPNFVSGITGMASFPANSAFIQTIDNSSSSKLYISAQGGIFFEGDQKLQTVSPTMKLQGGNLTLISGDLFIKTSQFADNGSRLRISPVAGSLQIFTPGSGASVVLFNGAGTNGINFDAAQRLISSGDGASSLLMQANAAELLGIGVAPTEKLQVQGNIRLSGVMNVAGTPGFTGTVSPVTSITVVGGIVTAVS